MQDTSDSLEHLHYPPEAAALTGAVRRPRQRSPEKSRTQSPARLDNARTARQTLPPSGETRKRRPPPYSGSSRLLTAHKHESDVREPRPREHRPFTPPRHQSQQPTAPAAARPRLTKWRRQEPLSHAARQGTCAVAPTAPQKPRLWRTGLKVDWQERDGRAQPIGTARGQRCRPLASAEGWRAKCVGWRRWPVFLCVGSAAWFVFLFDLCLLGWLGFAGFPLCLYFVAVLFTRWSLSFIKSVCGSLIWSYLKRIWELLPFTLMRRKFSRLGEIHLNRVQSAAPLAFACTPVFLVWFGFCCGVFFLW